MTNDIPDILTFMFADDVASFSDSVVRLQRLIHHIEDFCKLVGMDINLEKTKIMVFRNGGPLKASEKWYFDGKAIDVVSFYKYLGIYFTPKLIWSRTHEFQVMQSKKAASRIFKYQKSFGYFNPQDIFKLFDTIVKPILCYGAEIWGFQYYDKLEKVQSKFCIQYCCLNTNVADALALGECGRLPLAISYMTQCLKYWVRLLQMETHRYPKQCYEMLRSLDSLGRKTWASDIKCMLFTFGFSYVWIAQDVGNSQLLLQLLSDRLKDCYRQQWFGKINDMSKGEHYKHFKSFLEVEKYLSVDLDFKFRKVLANFRCSSHDLMIEKR